MGTEEKTASIAVRGLKKSFGAQTVLAGIDLDVRQGETVAVMGRSGTGKSVLLKLLIGLESPDAGSVSILGEEATGSPAEKLSAIRKKVGFLFQQAALYDSMTIKDNVIFPMSRHHAAKPEEHKKRAQELLASVGMREGYDKLPSEISGGMQKRVGLARALALDPEILLFDEPTAGLDPISSAEIAGLIVDLKKQRGLTAVVVTHDIPAARAFADRVALLDEGKIAGGGTFAELEKSNEPFVRRFLENCS